MFGKRITKIIIIEGMHCSHCLKRIDGALKTVEGVKAVSISLEDKKAEVILKKDIDNAALKKVIEDIGFEVIDIK